MHPAKIPLDEKRGLRREYPSLSCDCNEMGERERKRRKEEDGEPSGELGEKLMKNIKIREEKRSARAET